MPMTPFRRRRQWCLVLAVALALHVVGSDGAAPSLLGPKASVLSIRGGATGRKQSTVVAAAAAKAGKVTAAAKRSKGSPAATPATSSLMKVNFLMLMFYSTLGSAMPYIPLYYRKIGISDNVIGLLGAITPMVTFLVSPLWGALADSTGWHKQIMLSTFVGSVLVRCGLAMKMTHVMWLMAVVALSAVLNAPVKVGGVLRGLCGGDG